MLLTARGKLIIVKRDSMDGRWIGFITSYTLMDDMVLIEKYNSKKYAS